MCIIYRYLYIWNRVCVYLCLYLYQVYIYICICLYPYLYIYSYLLSIAILYLHVCVWVSRYCLTIFQRVFTCCKNVFSTPRLAVGLGCLQLPPGLLPLQAIPAGALDGIVGAGEMNQQQIHIVRLQTLPCGGPFFGSFLWKWMGNDLEFHLVNLNHDPKIAILLEIPSFLELATGFSTIPNVPGFLGSPWVFQKHQSRWFYVFGQSTMYHCDHSINIQLLYIILSTSNYSINICLHQLPMYHPINIPIYRQLVYIAPSNDRYPP